MADYEKRITFKKYQKRKCKFCVNKIKYVDYKDLSSLRSFTTERGKMLSGRITGNCARHQRQLASAIKNARIAVLMPFVNK